MAAEIIVVFDTSELRGLSPQGVTARVLKELVKSGTIEVHLPTIVERELVTQIAEKLAPLTRGHYQSIVWACDAEREGARKLLADADALLKAAEQIVAKGVAEWLDQLGTVRHPPSEVDADAVFDRYFAGSSAFRTRKSREDLPDEFIVGTVEQLAADSDVEIHVVTRDKRLQKACAEVDGVEVHGSLKELFACDAISPTASAAKILTFCRDRATDLISRLTPVIGESLVGEEITSTEFPSDNQDATITMFGEAEELEFDFEQMEAVSDDVVMLPFRCRVPNNQAELFIYKADYYAIEDSDLGISVIDSDWNRHYVLAEMEVEVEMEGTLAIVVKQVEENKYQLGDVEVSEIDEITVVERGYTH